MDLGNVQEIVHPIVLSQWGTGGGTWVLGDKLLVVRTLGVPVHQTPDLARLSLKPCFPLYLVAPSPLFGFGPVGFISHTLEDWQSHRNMYTNVYSFFHNFQTL